MHTSNSSEHFDPSFDGAVSLFDVMSKHFERVAVELAGISFDEIERGTEFVGELAEARTFDRMVEVEKEYWQSAQRAMSRHASRLHDLYAAIGSDLSKPLAHVNQDLFA
ncbi:MAG TPA: phasin family protein [Beijerinckiaceae bacterium]|jgi:hypothetical protein|nr:phasin family protein [Beijerinckiaceae bacterium]